MTWSRSVWLGVVCALVVGGLAGCAQNVAPEGTGATPSPSTSEPTASATVWPGVTGDPRCPGERILEAHRVEHWPDGGVTYYFDQPDAAGGDGWSTKPPAHFDPLTASAEQLKRYDYPPRPTAGKGAKAARKLAHWRRRVERRAKTTTRVHDYMCVTNSHA